MKITEIVNPTCRKDRPKAIIDKIVKRKLRSFDNLGELANFSRRHFHFVHTQESAESSPRHNEICRKLSIGSHLLWLDLDFDVDIDDLRKRFLQSGIKGFFYHSSEFYASGVRRVRISVVTKRKVLADGQTLYYARQFLAKLGYDNRFIKGLDESVYRPHSYFAPVMYPDGSPVKDYDKKGKSLFIFKGKPFRWTTQQAFQEQAKRTTNLKRLKQKTQFGRYGDFARKLSKFKNVEQALSRPNGTITIIFKNIPEKTKGGYYINPEKDPWVVFHPNKEKKPFYINVKLGKKDFKVYKKYVLKRFRPPDPLKDLTNPDKSIDNDKPYLNAKVFEKKVPLLFIESPTGSGKTTQLANWMRDFDGSVLFISVNRAQAITTHKSLLEKGLDEFECYIASDPKHKTKKAGNRYYRSEFIENIKEGYAPERVICGVLSLHHLIDDNEGLLRDYKVVVIDEITTLPRFAVSPVDLIAGEFLRFRRDMVALTQLLRNAKKVIGMDGYIAQPIIDAFSTISGKVPYLIRKNIQTNKKVEIYLTQAGNEPNIKGTITSKKYWSLFNKDVQKAMEKGKKGVVVSAFTHKKKAEEVASYIKHCVPNAKDKVKLITGDTMETEGALNTIRELDSHLDGKIVFLIYSPAITTGVDITQATGTNVYHIITGIQLTSHTHYQMTMRGRKAKSYKVLVPLFLADRTTKTRIDPEKQFNQGMVNLFETVPFRRNYKAKVLKAAVKDHNLKMGALLTFKYLETVTKNGQYPSTNSIQRKIRNNKLDDFINDYGVKTAIILEIAADEWDLYDYEYGTLGQYINLLAREGCLVSRQLDVKKGFKKGPSVDDAYYVKKYKNDIKKIFKYDGEIKNNSRSGLNNMIRRLKTGQRILNYIINKNTTSRKAEKTGKLLVNALEEHKIEVNEKEQESDDKTFISLYDHLVVKTFYRNISLEPEFMRLIKDGMHLTDRQKVTRVTYILRIIFKVFRKKVNKPHFTIKLDSELVKSIENMDSEHRRYLYT